METAFVNLTLLTLDPARRVIADGALILRDDRIAAVGPRAELQARLAACQSVRDCAGLVALPGFVNAHTHTFQSLLRGLADGLDLLGFLRQVIYPVTRAITLEDARIGACLSALEAIRCGTTCLIDNHSANTDLAATDAIAQAFAQAGLRALVARGFRQPTPRARRWNVPEQAFQFSLAEELEITRHLIEKWRAEAGGRVRVCPAPLTLFLSGPEALRAAKALADEFDAPMHVHVAEVRSEVNATLEDYGCREVEHLARVGVLDSRFHVVHGVWLEPREMDLMAENGGHVVHCPTSNMSLASGIAPVPEMLARGVNVALASDGIGNFNHDMFGVMRAACLLHRAHTLRPDALTSAQVLEMATLGGARALGLADEIGSLEAGKKADLMLLQMRQPHLVPFADLPTAIVLGAQAADVDTVIVDGRTLMEEHEVKTLNQREILAAAEAAGLALRSRAGLHSLRQSDPGAARKRREEMVIEE